MHGGGSDFYEKDDRMTRTEVHDAETDTIIPDDSQERTVQDLPHPRSPPHLPLQGPQGHQRSMEDRLTQTRRPDMLPRAVPLP